MNDFKTYTFMLLMSTSSLVVSAQRKVESGAYNLMLKALLKENVPEISAKKAHKEQEKYQFIDSREKAEYEVSHVKNAVWVGCDDFDTQRLKGIPKDQQIIVYCSVGARSEKITGKLVAEGYTNAHNMYGGVFEWINEGFPVFDMNGKQTIKVHAYSRTWSIWLKKGEKVYQ
ncbi:rhodanese-related sulfurtransferase [Pedobacter sp. UYP30]|uniref:rhodanese-like domain-containing protein n=1 Tax=Pedobacter sp. UYP30 TaxID=1756400 RepID=UPI0033995746